MSNKNCYLFAFFLLLWYNNVMGLDFYFDRNKKNNIKTNEIIEQLPNFCSLFFIGKENTTSPLTRLNYATDLKLFFKYLSEHESTQIGLYSNNIQKITLENLDKIDSTLIERFLSFSSMYDNDNGKIFINGEKGKARKLSTLRSFFGFYFNKNLLQSNIASKVQMPKIHDKSITRLEQNEIEKILDITETPNEFSEHQKKYLIHCSTRDNAILSLFLGTGIRVSECVGLNLEDFDFNTNSFKVVRKGGNQTILYLSDDVAKIMQQYIDYRNSINIDKNEKALFLSLQNKRLGVKSMQNLVKKYAKIASPLKNITPHKLRSTFGTNLYKNTNDIYVVADVLGHKDINTTKKHYAAISEDIKKNASNKIKLR